MNTKLIALLIAIGIICAFIYHKLTTNKDSYDSGEHVIAANGSDTMNYPALKLKFPPVDKPITESAYAYQIPVQLGMNLTFGQIMALGGDIFGTNEPISDATPENTINRFKQHYLTLAGQGSEVNEWSNQFGLSMNQVPNILSIFQREINMILHAINTNQSPKAGYAAMGNSINVDYNLATGGGDKWEKTFSDVYPDLGIIQLFPEGRMMQLADVNWDHFATNGNAWKAYFAGHSLALQTAAEAGKNNDINLLNLAYAYDAFACHFLSDQFASGHLRTPRKELKQGKGAVKPWIEKLGDYLSKLMHDEDNERGLLVANNACFKSTSDVPCRSWMSYGDNSLAEPQNRENLMRQHEALQQSVDEVWESFKQKQVVVSKVFDYVPNIDQSKVIPGKEQEVTKKTIGTNILGYCTSGGTCQNNLGPQWHPVGKENSGCWGGNKTVCQKTNYNHLPMFQYDDVTDTLYKRTTDGNDMTSVISGIKALYDFEPRLKSPEYAAHAMKHGIDIKPYFR